MRVAIAVLLAGSALPALAQWATPSPAGIARFEAADVNGDGRVDMGEAQVLWPNFTAREMRIYDATPDGGLDVFEFQTVRSARPVVEPGDGAPAAFDEAALEFRQLDANRDGGITPAELLVKYPEAAASFGLLDLDGDGRLSEAEFTGEASARR